MKRVFWGIAALLVVGRLAYAQQAPEKIAEDEFNKGNTAYNLGKWEEAVDHFTKAYEAWSQPEFLYNIAQSYRQAGNCKQALHFYKRFRSLKENDKQAPLSKQKREEVDRFIKQLTDCAAKADSTAGTKPDSLDSPPSTGMSGTQGTTSTTSPATTTTTQTTATTPKTTTPPPPPTTTPATGTKPPTTTGALEKPDDGTDEDEDETTVTKTTTVTAPSTISARAVTGIAVISSGDLHIPVQPSFAVIAGYPLAVGPMVLDLGAGVSYTPLPYQVMGEQKQGTMFGARAVISAQYPATPKLWLRGDVGGGIVSLGGLVMGNPITADYSAKSFTLPSVRVGIAADYLFTPNLAATVSPFGFAFSPGADGMYGDSLREIDVLIGLAYRQ